MTDPVVTWQQVTINGINYLEINMALLRIPLHWNPPWGTRDLMLQIGDGKAIEKCQRNINGALEALNVLTLAPQSG